MIAAQQDALAVVHAADHLDPVDRGGGRTDRTGPRSGWTRSPGPGWPPSTSSTWATATSCTFRTAELDRGPRPPQRLRRGRCAVRACGFDDRGRATGRPARGCEIGRALAERGEFDRGVRRQRPDGHRRAARVRRSRHRPCPATSASSASTTSPRRPTSTPSLTTVHQDFPAVGRRAIDLVTAALDGSTDERPPATPRTDRPRQHGNVRGESMTVRTAPRSTRWASISAPCPDVRWWCGSVTARAGQAEHVYPTAWSPRRCRARPSAAAQWALQVPADYVEVLRTAVPAAVEKAGVDPGDVIGIGTDFTACTMVPVLADGTPLCELPSSPTGRTPTESCGGTTPPSRRPIASTPLRRDAASAGCRATAG